MTMKMNSSLPTTPRANFGAYPLPDDSLGVAVKTTHGGIRSDKSSGAAASEQLTIKNVCPLKSAAGVRRWIGALMALLPLLLCSVAPAQQRPGKSQTGSKLLVALNENGSKEVQNRAAGDPSYVIGPQDVLDISVWKESELSRTVPVRPDGRISLPLLSDVQAAGLTPTQLAAHITQGLTEFIADPEVTVIVTTINSQRVYIVGEVMRPGTYPLLPGMTVLQALSSAGGFTQFANTKNIYVLRQENGKQVKFPFNFKDAVKGKKPEQNIGLKTGDTIIIP
jgi:polysaccharide export outer membrane protein